MEKNTPFAQSTALLDRGRHNTLRVLWNTAAFLLSSFGICVLSLFLAIGMFSIDMFFAYFRQPVILLLNWLPIVMVQLLLFCLFGRQWLAFLFTSLFFLGGSIAHFYKLKFRYDPLFFSDIKLMGAALGVVSGYDLTPNTRIIAAAVYVVLGTLAMLFLVKGRLRGLWLRVIPAVAVLISAIPLWGFVYSNDHIYNDVAVSDTYLLDIWSQQVYVSKGLVYPFIHSIKADLNTAPEGYDQAEAEELLSAYSDADIPAGRKVNLIGFQLEAFCDLEALGIEGISQEAYAPYRALAEESYTGRLIVNTFGGGTMDTERCFLSGSYALGNYTKNSYSNVRYLKSQGYRTVGSHPNTGIFYSRSGINANLGFDEYWFTDNHYEQVSALENVWMCDHILFPEVLRQYRELSADGQPVFSFNVTIQGHGPYNTTGYTGDTVYWPERSCSDYCYNAINNYLASLRDTQNHLAAFVDALREDSAPVVLVLYGDHKPWMGDNASILHELGVNIDLSTREGFLNYYSTSYLIWANDAAKELLGGDFSGEGPDVSAGFLMNLLFDKLGWEGSAFNQFGDKIRQTLPVVTSLGYYYENGDLTAQLSSKGREAFRELDIVSYYVNINYDNSATAGKEKG